MEKTSVLVWRRSSRFILFATVVVAMLGSASVFAYGMMSSGFVFVAISEINSVAVMSWSSSACSSVVLGYCFPATGWKKMSKQLSE